MENIKMDYKFIMPVWQDAAGDEDANISVTVNGVEVVSNKDVTSTDAESPTMVTWESTGLPDLAEDQTLDVIVTLNNDLYIDESTDRSVWVKTILYTDKADGSSYKKWDVATNTWNDITDWTDIENYVSVCPNTNWRTECHQEGIIKVHSDSIGTTNASAPGDPLFNIKIEGGEPYTFTISLCHGVMAYYHTAGIYQPVPDEIYVFDETYIFE